MESLKISRRKNIFGTPFYEEVRKTGIFNEECRHHIPMTYHYELAHNPENSIEMN